MEQQKTRVLIVDDNGQVRGALREIFQGQEDVSVVGEACDGTQDRTAVVRCCAS